jgi:hypothetical protein
MITGTSDGDGRIFRQVFSHLQKADENKSRVVALVMPNRQAVAFLRRRSRCRQTPRIAARIAPRRTRHRGLCLWLVLRREPQRWLKDHPTGPCPLPPVLQLRPIIETRRKMAGRHQPMHQGKPRALSEIENKPLCVPASRPCMISAVTPMESK